MPLAPGTRLGLYDILGPLGAGGMGEVYRARDTRLGRDVALKVLAAEMSADPVRLERFTREARAIAALNHPHIVTIYSTEDAEGIRFLTMELVEGQTLGGLIGAGGLPVARFLELAIPLTDALKAAHLKQITHRDLKPGNVMVATDGRVKVLDFGLARVGGAEAGEHTIAATRADLTAHGTIVGTMPYMSPEQVEGRDVDHRSDLFSLGVMFYEMLAGVRPFDGPSSAALMSAILRDTPPSVIDTRVDVPEALDRLIARLIEKRPEDRVQTTRDVFNELRHVQKQLDSGAAKRPGSGTTATRGATLHVAVLPFTVRGADPEADAMAAGLTEDVTSSLARFPGLSVIAAQSARAFKDSPLDVRQIAERLGARYIVAGSVRKAGANVRVTAQLIDARSGAQLWTDTYDRSLETFDPFALQDDVTDHIVATVADPYGVLARSMVQAVQERGGVHDATAPELLIRTWAFQHVPLPDVHAELRAALEAALRADPANAHLWAELANMYVVEHSLWCNPQPDSLGRALDAARRAVEIDRHQQNGWVWQAIAQFHLHDRAAFEEACARAIRINPRSAYALAWMGNVLTHIGEYQRGCALTERAMAINPAHPGWLHVAVFNRHFADGEFGEALQAARRINMREFFWMHLAIAAACGQLGLSREGREAAEHMVRLAPFLADETNLREFVTRWYWPEEMIERLLDGIRRAGQAAPSPAPSTGSQRRPPSSASSSPSSRAADTLEDLTLAVVPFTARGGDATAVALAEALTDDVTNGLSRFEHLRVMSPETSPKAAGAGAAPWRYVLEGTVRTAGRAVRVGARVVDTRSSANVWAENFDVDGDSGVFTLQDDLAGRIVATVGDPTGVLAKAILTSLADVPIEQLGPEALVVRYYAYTEQLVPGEHARLRDALERFVERQPGSALGWSLLARVYEHEHSQGLNTRPDSIARQRSAAQRALEIDSHSQQVWAAVASAHKFAGDIPALRGAVERAVAINPLNADLVAFCALLLAATGGADERPLELARMAMHHKPRHPGWYHFPAFNALYMQGQDEAALAEVRLVNMPKLALMHMGSAAAAGQLGRAADARLALEAIEAIDSSLLDVARATRAWLMWIREGPLLDRLVEGLEKALALTRSAGTSAPSRSAGTSLDFARPSTMLGTTLSPSKGRDESVPASADTTGAAQSLRSISPDRPRSGSTPSATAAGPAAGMRVAVLPFTARGGDEAMALAEGLTDDITTALARFPYLKVVSRVAVNELKGHAHDSRTAGAELGARFLLEGSLHQAATSVRVSVRLSDRETGAHLWAETLDRDLSAGLFAVQYDIASRLAATVADAGGVLVRSMGEAIRDLPLEGLGLDDLVLRYQLYTDQFTAADHAALCRAFEAMVAREPGAAQAWAYLGMLVAAEMFFGLNPQPRSLERLREYVERATMLDSSIQHGWTAAVVLAMFERDRATLEAAAERAIALNPLHTRTLAVVGVQLIFSGETDRGAALLERAMALNPRYPGWYLIGSFLQAYERGEYEAAHRHARRMGMPKFVPSLLAATAAAGQTGSVTDARAAVEALARINPALLDPLEARRLWATLLWDTAAVDRLVDAFAKALSIAAVTPPASSLESGAVRPGSVSVAVLPFASRSADHDTTELADGLTDGITSGLSRFGYLNVLSRSLAQRLAREQTGVNAHARYAIDGNVRRAGQAIRTSVTLVDTHTGSNLWTSTYDRDLSAGAFTVQDDVSSAVVATLGDQTGVLMRAMAASIADQPLDRLTAAELVVQCHLYTEHFNPAEHARLRDALERGLEREPRAAEGWACLSLLYEHEHGFRFNTRPDALVRQRRAAEKARELDRHSQQAWIAMASVHVFARDLEALKIAVERAVAVNPLNANMLALGAVFLSTAGEYDRASALVQQAIQLKPQHPGWYYFALFNAAYARGDYEEALRQNKKVNMPRNPMAHLSAAAASGHLGRAAEARAALAALRAIDPALADVEGARAVWTIWTWSEDRLASLVDGFTKAKALDARAEVRSDAGREQSIAVLPFADLSETKDQDWFCDGIAEEILNALARLPGLKVIARTSAFAFKGQDLPVDRIAATLGVTSVLDGSVRRVGSRIRVAAQLVTAADGSHLWSERYDRELSDVFAVQDDIASAIAKELRVRLAGAAPAAREYRPAVPAYEAFLMGRHHVWRHTPEAYEAGYRSYEQAIALDPGYADPHAGIAELLHIRASLRGPQAQQCAAAIRPALERALALDPLHPEANAWLGIIACTYEYNWREAEERFRIAMASDPVAPRVRHINAYFRLRFIGRADEAVAEHHRALEGDPLNLIMRVGLATSLTCAGRHAEAADEAHRLLQLAPEFVASYTLLPLNVAEEPLSVSLPYAEQLHARAPWCAGGIGLLAGLLRRAGQAERAAALLREVEDAEIYGNAVDLALNHLACGEVDQAFGYLTILASQHHPLLMMNLVGGPYAAALRASPRWPALAATVGLANS